MGKTVGRLIALPSALVKVLFVCFSGATTLTGPLAASVSIRKISAPATSATSTHGNGWLPPATGPPTPSLNGVSIFGSAPPSRDRTTPVRVVTTRTPSSSALRASASHACTPSLSKPLPGGESSPTGVAPRGYQPSADCDTSTSGRG